MKKAKLIILLFSLLLISCRATPSDKPKQENTKGMIVMDPALDEKYQYMETVTKPVKLEITNVPQASRFLKDRGTMDQLPTIESNSQVFEVDFRGYDVSHLKIGKQYLDNLKWATFSTTTKWPQTLPQEFNPAKVLDDGKNPGLHVRSLHEQGITGAGIGIAIIDQNLLVGHEEYKDRLKFYEEIHFPDSEASMHGPAVASIAVGKTVGVAPEADLYYIAGAHGEVINGSYETDFTWLAMSIDRILEVNKTLSNERKIRVISISVGWNPNDQGYYETVDAVNRAREQGIFVVSSSLQDTYGYALQGLGRSWDGDADDAGTYMPGSFWLNSFYREEYANSNVLLVPMDRRTTADSSGDEGYVYYAEGGLSWAIPYAAGLYALACQVKKDITPREFWDKALRTGDSIDIEKDGNIYQLKRIVNPVKLIESLKQ